MLGSGVRRPLPLLRRQPLPPPRHTRRHREHPHLPPRPPPPRPPQIPTPLQVHPPLLLRGLEAQSPHFI
uniref:Uncharacterized protein n=1 Tax=Arcella intermedia TaxID=1963864 RepID=A0A6B2LQG5_9EUKA